MNFIFENVYIWFNISKEVKFYIVSFIFRDKDGKFLFMLNFSSYVDIYIVCNISDLFEEEEFYVIFLGSKKYI